MNYISAKELKKRLSENHPIEIIDIREEFEYEDNNCGWKHIPMAQILPRVNEIPKNKDVVFACISGKKAGAIVSTLERKFQFNNLLVLEGGYTAFSELS